MVYQPGIPTGTVTLDVDYQNLQDNFRQLDTTFGVDHYKFSDNTSNNGFHNKVTTPVYAEDPPTTAPPSTSIDPVFYGFQQYPALGVLQYSRGPNDAVPTTVTSIHSPETPIALTTSGMSTPILDFTGIEFAVVRAYGFNAFNNNNFTCSVYATITWLNNSFRISETRVPTVPVTTILGFTTSGNVLQLENVSIAPANASDCYWTLEIVRLR